ncbi:MerR family transcriptional regulator [Allokutzneria sp. A3M-2-11 16]|uniref:MerR family transcriptional regulator n=1 Tax=Allokutzneria sp. A3M-2-11 16 TaxID=2962043 RepID=UPI0020B69E67|nr:MerR family transcriptional regulator [Allokutzneria sp. A3M-2-11 16]MCP3802910.1 MerR family transcriptional regulator [Allokutzneria sp. A3M-2-11 16]
MIRSSQVLTIAEVVAATKLPTSTLRFYEREGLITSVARDGAGRRVYAPDILARLAVVELAKQAGFTIAEVSGCVDAETGMPGRGWRELAEAKLVELEARIAEAERARAVLTHALECPDPSFGECPVFRGSVRAQISAMRGRTTPPGDSSVRPLSPGVRKTQN